MKKYSVIVVPQAERKLDAIYAYIAEELQEPDHARNQYERLKDKIASLDMMPERCRILDDEPWHGLGIRRLLVDNFSIFYRIADDAVWIVDILYSRSDILHRLRNLSGL